jgi:peptidoglycan/LPS O-acetylase OafA/YrhL
MHPRVSYLSNLTPLRGLAALLVAIFHYEMVAGRFVPAAQTMFLEKCYLMVDLFFIMSGFIMMHVYGQGFRPPVAGGTFREFMVARFARIYPLHIFSLILLVGLVMVLPPVDLQSRGVENPAAILTNALLLHSMHIHSIYTWNIPSWSISAEWWCYLLFPLLVYLLARWHRVTVVVYILAIVAAYASIMYLLPRVNPMYPAVAVPHNINTTYDYGFLRGLAGFMAGMLLYILYGLPAVVKIISRDVFSLLMALLVGCCLHGGWNDAICVLGFCGLVLGFASNQGRLSRVCGWRPLQYLGDISYSIYLMQIFLQVPFSHGLRLPGVTGMGRGKLNIAMGPGLLYCGMYVLLLIGISSATYYLLEKPCRRYINRAWA